MGNIHVKLYEILTSGLCIITEKQSYYDETRKRAHDLETIRAGENLKLSHGGD